MMVHQGIIASDTSERPFCSAYRAAWSNSERACLQSPEFSATCSARGWTRTLQQVEVIPLVIITIVTI